MSLTSNTVSAAAPMPTPSGGSEREVFLDAVRVIALVRVVLWHALGAAVLTYFVAAVPTMFFVTGSLLAKSLRRGAVKVIVDRARRILVPLWVFAFGAYLVMATAHALDRTPKTAVPWRDIPFWILPIDDPVGSKWEGGYMSSPLWYLRALLWLILLSPLLWWLVRRAGLCVLAVPLTAVFVLEWLSRRGSFTGTWAWRVGDLALYSCFVILGFVHRLGRLQRLTRWQWAIIAALAAAAAAVWCTTQPVPGHVVNDSHPAHLFVGLGWLSAFFVARPFIERVAATRPGRGLIAAVSPRTITIYLWHSTAVIVSFEVLRRASLSFPPGGWVVALLTLTAGVTTLFVLAFGWVEDLANKRPADIWPQTAALARRRRRVPFAAVAIAVLGALVLVAAADESVFAGRRAEAASEPAAGDASAAKGSTLRVPSQAPKAPVFVPATTASPTTTDTASSSATTSVSTTTVPPTTTRPPFDASTQKALTDALGAWMAANAAPGVEVSIYQPGRIDWSLATGTDPASKAAVDNGTRFDIESITKTFTAALVWRAVDQGLLDPDAPIGALKVVPEFTYAQLTVRQLLRHTTGLVNYRDTPAYLSNALAIDTPRKALAASAGQPLKFTPGTQVEYSSSNYLVLGFLLEQVTGRTYDSLLADLVQQAGLGPIPHSAPAPGLPNFSTAGMMPTAAQLARWGVALLKDNTPQLSEASRAAMRDIDPATGFGGGLIGYCPCTKNPDGSSHFTGLGHTGGYTEFQYTADDDIAIAINVTDSIYVPDNRYDSVQALIGQLRNIALGKPS